MRIIDGFLNSMKLNDEDDDYEFDNEEYEEVEEPKAPKKKLFGSKKKEEDEEPVVKEKPAKPVNKITPISRTSRKQAVGMEVCVVKPTSVEDGREITDTLLEGKTVVLNVEGLNLEIAQRIIDFTSGSCYAMHGNLQKISNYIFIITPENVDISGDFQQIIDSFDNSGFQF